MSPWLRPAVAPARTDVTPVLSMGADGLRRHVLLAEDNPVNQPVARGLLARLGCDVDVAANGSGAVRLFVRPLRSRADGLHDAGVDGYEATVEIRRIARRRLNAGRGDDCQRHAGRPGRCLAAGRFLGAWAEDAPH